MSNPVKMVEASNKPDTRGDGEAHGILKNAHEGGGPKHAHFDEAEIAAHDATRGQCMKIDDPKTPFHEEESDDEDMGAAGAGNNEEVVDPELDAHLAEAKANQAANAITISGVKRQ